MLMPRFIDVMANRFAGRIMRRRSGRNYNGCGAPKTYEQRSASQPRGNMERQTSPSLRARETSVECVLIVRVALAPAKSSNDRQHRVTIASDKFPMVN
jgi:hypothetical protein